ncbi:MAG: hypothetical protein GY953_47065, partial [bacterium]|nr:hypothetical protein [bacterium]
AVLAAWVVISSGAAWSAEVEKKEEKPLTAAQKMEKRFNEFPLKVGDPFPEVDIYDADGNAFNTKSLKGKYTVIVNGCLT